MNLERILRELEAEHRRLARQCRQLKTAIFALKALDRNRRDRPARKRRPTFLGPRTVTLRAKILPFPGARAG